MVGSGGVLLDDEGAGADPANRKLLVALDLGGLDLDRGDPRPARPLAQERLQLRDRLLGALGVDEHTAVIGIAHPAQHAEPVRPPPRSHPESHALDMAAHRRP